MTVADGRDVDALMGLLETWYRPLRQQRPAAGSRASLREDSDRADDCQCSERFLQILWNEQRLTALLRTHDGRRVEVISPGTWNVAGGPDFRQAVIRLDGRLCRGAVEIHRTAADWSRHGHDRDPAYAEVVLHVVWSAPPGDLPAGLPPTLELRPHLEAPLRDLLDELQAATYPYARQVTPGACAARWALTDDTTVRRLLRTAALARFEDKALRLHRQALAVGCGQPACEAFFAALGYTANRAPFRAPAQLVPLQRLRALGEDHAREAELFGAAGLLPDPSTAPVLPEWRGAIRDLWDRWWTGGGTPLGLAWQRAGSRPLNSPERRLAAGCAWLQACRCDPETWMTDLATACSDTDTLRHALLDSLEVHSPWEAVQDSTRRLPRPARLLGLARRADLLANVLLPFLQVLGTRAGDERLCRLARAAYLDLPRLQDNRLLREATHRFLVPPSRSRELVRSAADQQGLLELYRAFCLALDGDCADCPFTTAAGTPP